MTAAIDALKKTFREGRREEAVAACEALCHREPGNIEARQLAANMHLMTRDFGRALEKLQQVWAADGRNPDVLFNLGMCERELQKIPEAAGHFKLYAQRFPDHPDGWASLAECQLQLNDAQQGLASAERALQLDAASVPAWTVRGNCQKALGQFEKAVESFSNAIRLAPRLPDLYVHRGDLHEATGQLRQAADDYKSALALAPGDGPTLKKATLCLLQIDAGQEGVELCRQVLKAQPDNLTAKLGAEWLLSQMVPLWHVPMMNEEERNRAYFQGLEAVVTPETTVFEVGTGSGLLAMMAARLGAKKVVTCEAVGLVADTARKIVERNQLQDKVTVLAKPSYAVQVPADLAGPADILVHEIFSSELLGEHVLPALEDAKARLLKPGGTILPGVASIMVALVGGDGLGSELHVDKAFGFDLSPFNAIHPKKRPIYREDLPRVLLSGDVEAFRFDFNADASFPPEKKELRIPVTGAGLCYGLVQWIRFEFPGGSVFENHPSRPRPVASWQQTIYRFDAPQQLRPGQEIVVDAMHDRSRPWFDLAS